MEVAVTDEVWDGVSDIYSDQLVIISPLRLGYELIELGLVPCAYVVSPATPLVRPLSLTKAPIILSFAR